jgi:hypothetical protein
MRVKRHGPGLTAPARREVAFLAGPRGARRIRPEDDSMDPRALPRPVCSPDSARG